MTNREKYAEQIIDIALKGSLSVEKATVKPYDCGDLKCADCIVCNEQQLMKWSEQEYVEPAVDWSKVPVDTKILVRDSTSDLWLKKYFARYEGNRVYTWKHGTTSYSSDGYNDVTYWKFAKLAEED